MTRSVDELAPLVDTEITIYTCGLTVYSQPHIGNWVGYIYWDVLVRTLEKLEYKVKRVQNITDVGHLVSDDDNGEDKMEKGARKEGKTAWEIADKYIAIANREAYELLQLKRPLLVRATDKISEQIDMVKSLEEKGFTYIIEGEGVYFDTSKLKDYGKLARLDVKGLEAGNRVAFKNKRSITDFALWKFSPKEQKRDMEWDSPWGIGFPGWHLECSAIAMDSLGEQIDIHAGGVDHIPIHHTNEIAQTESVTEKPFAQIWLHNNHLKVDGKKMSKSLGNIYTLEDIIAKGFDIQSFKLLVLSKNYHTEGNFTWDILEAAQNRLNNWQAVADLVWQFNEHVDSSDTEKQIIASLTDNLNTPESFALVDAYFDTVLTTDRVSPSRSLLLLIEELFGLSLQGGDITPSQKKLLVTREAARVKKDWQLSDDLRDTLKQEGIAVRDEPFGQVWSRV
jgi:cysteinyl-tRNA synthetase